MSLVFEMKNISKLTYFLGLQASYNKTWDVFVNQVKYAKELLNKPGMSTCKACLIPCKPHNQVSKTDGEPLFDPTMYKNIVDALQYLTFTRPGLSYPVNSICQHMTTPTYAHFHLVKRILRCVKELWIMESVLLVVFVI